MLGYLIRFRRMKLDLEYLVDVARAFREEYLLVVSSDQVPSDHSLWLTDNFEEVAIE